LNPVVVTHGSCQQHVLNSHRREMLKTC
jgi:hypothetical protein